MQNNRVKFRFEDLDIWKVAVDISLKLFTFADTLEKKKLFRFAEQIRGAALSVPNNIAEGSGSTSKKEFVNFLNIARRSVFENASMLIIFNKIDLIESAFMNELLLDLDKLGRMITAFSRTLKD
jgi:four helix bundle protein